MFDYLSDKTESVNDYSLWYVILLTKFLKNLMHIYIGSTLRQVNHITPRVRNNTQLKISMKEDRQELLIIKQEILNHTLILELIWWMLLF